VLYCKKGKLEIGITPKKETRKTAAVAGSFERGKSNVWKAFLCDFSGDNGCSGFFLVGGRRSS
jgi:hypothetical protein